MLNRTQKCLPSMSMFFLPIPKKFCTWFYFYAKLIVCMRGIYTPPGILFCATPYHKSHCTSLCQVRALGYKSCILVAHDWGSAVAW